jgi:hypothetical protein
MIQDKLKDIQGAGKAVKVKQVSLVVTLNVLKVI